MNSLKSENRIDVFKVCVVGVYSKVRFIIWMMNPLSSSFNSICRPVRFIIICLFRTDTLSANMTNRMCYFFFGSKCSDMFVSAHVWNVRWSFTLVTTHVITTRTILWLNFGQMLLWYEYTFRPTNQSRYLK